MLPTPKLAAIIRTSTVAETAMSLTKVMRKRFIALIIVLSIVLPPVSSMA
jgi:hypothetical protein